MVELKGLLGNQKWFLSGITITTCSDTFIFKSVKTADVNVSNVLITLWTKLLLQQILLEHCRCLYHLYDAIASTFPICLMFDFIFCWMDMNDHFLMCNYFHLCLLLYLKHEYTQEKSSGNAQQPLLVKCSSFFHLLPKMRRFDHGSLLGKKKSKVKWRIYPSVPEKPCRYHTTFCPYMAWL